MPSSKNKVFRRFAVAITTIFSLPVMSGALANTELLSYLPRDAKAVGSLQLCLVPGNEKAEIFACREYRAHDGDYSVLFQGGRLPHVLLKRPKSGEPVFRNVSERDEPWQFDLPIPLGVPVTARHVGTGVCTDPRERLVPCAAFWQPLDYRSGIRSYLVLYDPLGGGPQDINVIAFDSATMISGVANRTIK